MFEFLFKYSPAVFEESELVLASEWPLWLLALLGAAAVLVITFSLWRRRRFRPWQLGSLALLQSLMIALVLLALWQPGLLTERLVRGENAVAILLDTSASMTQREENGTRMEQALTLLTEQSLAPLAQEYELLPYHFAEAAQSLNDFSRENLPAPGAATDLGAALLQTLRQSASASLGAVIVLSDGADNDGSIGQGTLNEIAAYGVPVHTVGLGRERIPEDLELQDVVLPAKALPGSTLSARLTVRHDQGGQARIKAYDGERLLASRELSLDANTDLTMAYMDIDVHEPGQLDLRFTLDPISGESNLVNNSRRAVVDVPEQRYRILYVEGEPRWEYKFMRRALDEDPSILFTTLLRVTPNKYYRQGIENPEQLAEGFPTEREDLYNYDALIIGSMEVAQFSEEQQAMIRDFVSERGGSLMMLAGLEGLGQGGWSESVVHEILPARLSFDDQPLTREQVKVVLGEHGALSPLLQLAEDAAENRRLWNELPAVADYQGLGDLRPAASTLLRVQTPDGERPLLVRQPYGRGQSFILATGGTWRWQMSLPVEDMRHETFWRQLARGLVANSPLPFELSTRDDGDTIRLRAELRDPEAEENAGVDITAVVAVPQGGSLALELQPLAGEPGAFEARFQPDATGMYNIEAITHRDGEALRSARTALRHEDNREAFGIRQNSALLRRLAEATGGNYWSPAQWGQLPEAISYSSAGITERQIRPLWDAPAIFLALFLLKALEWLLRRRWSTI